MDRDEIRNLSSEQLGLEFGIQYGEAYRQALRTLTDKPSLWYIRENNPIVEQLHDEIGRRNPNTATAIIEKMTSRIEASFPELTAERKTALLYHDENQNLLHRVRKRVDFLIDPAHQPAFNLGEAIELHELAETLLHFSEEQYRRLTAVERTLGVDCRLPPASEERSTDNRSGRSLSDANMLTKKYGEQIRAARDKEPSR
jgi:hypothetical protein